MNGPEVAGRRHELDAVAEPASVGEPIASPAITREARSTRAGDAPPSSSDRTASDAAFDSRVEEVCRDCATKTRIRYRYRDAFFKPGTLRINHHEVGRSDVIDAPTTIFLELLYLAYEQLRDLLRVIRARLFPRRDHVYCSTVDGSLVGAIVHPSRTSDYVPIPGLDLEFWGRTWWLRWRKLSHGVTRSDGSFELPYDLRQARNWFTASLRFEIHALTHIRYDDDGTPRPHRQIVHSIRIPRSDPCGMRYNLRTIQLPFWEYRTDTDIPRVRIDATTRSACEKYARGRVNALYQQLIPIQLTKWKHLLQIRYARQTIDLASIQADYPENLTRCIEKRLPGYTRGDAWFVERLTNGMNRASFFPADCSDETATPRGPSSGVRDESRDYWVKYFGICDYEHNDEYALPDAAVLLRVTGRNRPVPIEIRLRGRLSAFDRDPHQVRVFRPTDGDDWQYAKRVFRVTAALATEVDEHFAGTHLNVEQYSIAAHRHLRRNPVAWLLFPHLKEASLINHASDRVIIRGYLPRATALTADGLVRRTRDVLGVQDWKRWRPMTPLGDWHRCAQAERLFWEGVVKPFVHDFIERYRELIETHWREVFLFSEDLVAHSVPVFSDDGHSNDQRRERVAYYRFQYAFDASLPRRRVGEHVRAVSPITTTEDSPGEEDIQNLKDACSYAIMMATYMHTWINEHQYDDLGEVLYACGGLRFGTQERGVLAPESDLSIAPDLRRSTEMLWFTNFLSRTEYGFITRNEEGDVHPELRERLLALSGDFAELGVDVTAIESRTNI